MIYLFNSGYYNEYAINVLNTLHLPSGIENTFRYSSTPQHCYIQESLKSTKASGNEVLIMFIDRNDINGFKYYPLRKGKLINIERNETKYHFSVQLGEHYTVDDIDSFNSVLHQKFSQKVPKPACDEDRTKDGPGFFAFEGEDITTTFSNIENPWTAIVHQLSKLKVFKDGVTLFTKVDFKDLKGNKIKIKSKNGTSRICLKKNETYKLNLSYYYHDFKNDGEPPIEVELDEKERSFSVVKKIQEIGNKQGKLDYEININSNPEQKSEGLLFLIKRKSSDHKMEFFAKSPTPVVFVYGVGLWIQLAIIAFLIGVCNWLIDFNAQEVFSDLSQKGQNLEIYEQILLSLSEKLIQYTHLYPVALNIIISMLTFLMFWRFGRSIEK